MNEDKNSNLQLSRVH